MPEKGNLDVGGAGYGWFHLLILIIFCLSCHTSLHVLVEIKAPHSFVVADCWISCRNCSWRHGGALCFVSSFSITGLGNIWCCASGNWNMARTGLYDCLYGRRRCHYWLVAWWFGASGAFAV